MRLTINETSNAKKVTGKTQPEFIRNIESNFGLNIDSAYTRKPEKFIVLYKDRKIYEAEVTQYFNDFESMFELMDYNIAYVGDRL